MPSEARNILLVRLDGLGDALVCVPALDALREAWPDARFGAVCSPGNADLFARSRVARVHVLCADEDVRAVAAELRSASYTDAIVATEEPIGYTLARDSGARRRAGFWHRFEKPFKSLWQRAHLTDAVYRPAAWVRAPEHEVLAIHRLARRLGAPADPSNDPRRLRRWLDVRPAAAAVGSDGVLFQAAPKWLRGGWDARSLSSAIAAASRTFPARRWVLVSSPADAGLVAGIMEHLPAASVADGTYASAPPASLGEWLGTIASAGVVVTPDTGAAHAAGMLGVPVVDVFEAARFEQLSGQWRPWASPSRCIVKPPYSDGADVELGARIAAALRELAATTDAVR